MNSLYKKFVPFALAFALAFSEKDKNTNDDPKTGDHAPTAWLIALCASALTVCAALLKKRGTSREI